MFEQMDLFATSYEDYKITKKIRLIECFGGIGAQSKALEILGADFEHHRLVEWAWKSILAYNAIHIKDFSDHSEGLSKDEIIEKVRGISTDYNKPLTDKQLSALGEEKLRQIYSAMVACHDYCPDISRLKGEDLQIEEKGKYCYVLTYSFPCFTKDQLVLTKEEGYVPFIDLRVGMSVLAKDGKWHKIAKFFDQGKKQTCFVYGQCFDSIHTTPNHKFWVRRKNGGEPHWVHAEDLSKGDCFGVPVISEERDFHSSDKNFWRLLGMYLGDGWLNASCHDVRISGNEGKREKLESLLKAMGIPYTVS